MTSKKKAIEELESRVDKLREKLDELEEMVNKCRGLPTILEKVRETRKIAEQIASGIDRDLKKKT